MSKTPDTPGMTIDIIVHQNGSATAKVGGKSKTFPDLHAAAEWGEKTRRKVEGEKNG